MKLYHYSTELYDQLKSKRVSGTMTPQDLKWDKMLPYHPLLRDVSYNDSISFFFDPIPSDIMDLLYGGKHPVWFKGNKLYQYEVELDMLPQKILYQIVESDRSMTALDTFEHDYKVKEWNAELLTKWFNHINAEKIRWCELAKDLDKLKSQVFRFQNTTRDFFIKASKRKDFKDNFMKYAAAVPHVMCYPETGIVTYEVVRQITIGERGAKFIKRYEDKAF